MTKGLLIERAKGKTTVDVVLHLCDIQIGRPEKIIEQDAPDVALRFLGCFWNIEAARYIEVAYSGGIR